jgi:hypothetical protein
MVVPQALEQLLRRPDALAGAQQAARANDDQLLAGYFFEAMRFDPLGPALPRVATQPTVIAAGTSRATEVPEGATVYAAFSSAMMDERRVLDPHPSTCAAAARMHSFARSTHLLGAQMNKAPFAADAEAAAKGRTCGGTGSRWRAGVMALRRKASSIDD